MKKRILLLQLLLSTLYLTAAYAQQKEPVWDNTKNKNWSKDFKNINIQSTADGSFQKAWFHATASSIPQPLIISLHTWSGDYNQEDPLAKEVLLRDWNYIHPDFRGANNKPEGCGSQLVIADLEDAIRYAIKTGNVDSSNVHIIGVSGGGYATMLAYMKLNYPVKSFNAWVGISDLSNWYWESKGRKAKYATDIEQVAMKNGVMSWQELDNRSPVKLSFPAEKRKNAVLNIYAGVHDGYTGSVPISHSISFYNKIAAALFPGIKENLIDDSTIISLVTKRINPKADTSVKLSGRTVHLFKHLPNLSLTIFEGGHEMLVPPALVLPPIDENKNLKHFNFLTVGDSNGAFDFGWPQQMKKLMPYATIINKSISGNTIGFDNLDRPQLNTLTNINQYLDEAYKELGANNELDYIFLDIGTNDTKIIFKDRQKEVLANMDMLLKMINSYVKEHNRKLPRICIITPSPMDEQKIDKIKYGGGNARIQKNNKQFKKIAVAHHVDFIDSYSLLNNDFSKKTTDGIHLDEKTQFELAVIIISYINKKDKR